MSLKKIAWTPEEEKYLVEMVADSSSWQEVSNKLWKLRYFKTKRSTFDCKAHYFELFPGMMNPFPSGSVPVPTCQVSRKRKSPASADRAPKRTCSDESQQSSPNTSRSSSPNPSSPKLSIANLCNPTDENPRTEDNPFHNLSK